MKIQKILILVDVPEKLQQLLTYGLPLAHQFGAQLWIQYAYDIPPELVGEVHISKDTLEKCESVVFETIASVEKALNIWQDHSPYVVISVGNLVHKMNQLIDQENMDLVLVGNRRGGGWLNHVFENNTIDVIRHAHCPVLSVPETAVFYTFQRIALAADLKLIKENILYWLLDFIKVFQAQTDVVHISNTPEDASRMEFLLDRPLQTVPHQFFNMLSKNIGEGIEQHVAQYHNDLVVLIPRDHPFLDRLFHKSITRQVAYHTQVPLLTIHASHGR